MSNRRCHILVSDSVHRKLKIVSAETGICMKHLAENGIKLILNEYQNKNKKIIEGEK